MCMCVYCFIDPCNTYFKTCSIFHYNIILAITNYTGRQLFSVCINYVRPPLAMSCFTLVVTLAAVLVPAVIVAMWLSLLCRLQPACTAGHWQTERAQQLLQPAVGRITRTSG